jgi:multidrug efflux pump subunit AcrA (membrane-fusion protein)
MTKKIVLIGLLVLAVLVSACGGDSAPTPSPAAQTSYIPIVSVTGELVPATWVTLSHERGGTAVEVLVESGDQVAAGAPLILLDTNDLALQLESAQQEVAAQQAALEQLRKGSTQAVIDRADRDNAYQIEQAEITLRAKRQQLAQAQAEDPENAVAAAEARVLQVQRQLAQTRAQDPAPEVAVAQIEVERAQIALSDVQNEYNKALDRPWEDQDIRDALADQLEQAQLNYRAAQARLDSANNADRAHALGLETLQAQLAEAQAALAQAQDGAAAQQKTIEILQTDIAAVESQLAYLRAWDNPFRDEATQEEIDRAEARLAQARVSVSQIEQQLRDATVTAPFAGTIGEVNVRVGEQVSPGQPLVAMGDLATLRVETTDLDEIDVVRVSLDQQVAVTFDALPDRVFEGRVTRISPKASSGTGGVHYTVVIELAELDPVLRWGMTAFVDIETEE